MSEFMDIVESDSFHKLLAALFMCSICFIAILYLIISIIRNDLDTKAMKFFGVLTISGFALFTNNWIIYILVTLVASTLITVPKFLERILEITLKNKNYSLSSATKKERINKNLKEVEQFSKAESDIIVPIQEMDSQFNFSSTPLEQQVELIISFENEILDALESEKERMILNTIKFNQILTKPNRKTLVLDVVLSRENQDIVMEIQPLIYPDLLYKYVDQLREQCTHYKKYLRNDNNQNEVKGILCTLNYPELNESIVGGVAILKYDLERDEFVNLSDILEWL